ncbi:hypothetical protein [Persicobacter sp. CCB-QB2]|nr:hypothetical protein [Persicobacter sp. CCB-QB2]
MLQRRVVDKLGFSVHLHAKENNIDLVLEILKPDNFKPSVFSAELDACLENLRTEYKGQFKVSVEERLNQYVVGVVLTPWVDA